MIDKIFFLDNLRIKNILITIYIFTKIKKKKNLIDFVSLAEKILSGQPFESLTKYFVFEIYTYLFMSI